MCHVVQVSTSDYCDTRYINTLKVVSIPVSYCDTAMHRCIIPSLQATLLFQYRDHPQAGHLGPDKTAAKIRQVGYWVGMLHDMDVTVKIV